MDKFEEWLQKRESNELVKRALTAESYRNINHNLEVKDIAFELATYGDKLISFCYADILLDEVDKLSKEIEKYISDERWVTVIAKHYDLLKYILYDEKDVNIIKDYDYSKPKNVKYISTAVEAMIGAIYKSTNDLELIKGILIEWMNL